MRTRTAGAVLGLRCGAGAAAVGNIEHPRQRSDRAAIRPTRTRRTQRKARAVVDADSVA